MTLAVSPFSQMEVAKHGEWTRINVPARKRWLLISFTAFWLCLWTVAGLWMFSGLIGQIHEGSVEPFFVIWLMGWAAGWVHGIVILAWRFWGRDTIWIGEASIVRRLAIGPFGKSYEYDVSRITRAWWKKHSFFFSVSRHNPFADHCVAMLYGGKEIKMANGVHHGEAQIILDALSQVAGIPQR